jgi:hypothetical protein
MSNENWDWVNAMDNHWVSFSAVGIDGVTREAEFYPRGYEGDRITAMYSSAAVAVPELSVTATLTATLLALCAILIRIGNERNK